MGCAGVAEMAEPCSLRVRIGDHRPDDAHSELRRGRATPWSPERTEGRLAAILSAVLALAISALATGCSPEVGSDAWCENMVEKPKGDWTASEAAGYARHCLFR